MGTQLSDEAKKRRSDGVMDGKAESGKLKAENNGLQPVGMGTAGTAVAQRVNERLRVLGEVINALRFATPGAHAFNTPAGTLTIAKEHDLMVTRFVVAVQEFLEPLDLDVDVDTASLANVRLTARWKAETQKAESGK